MSWNRSRLFGLSVEAGLVGAMGTTALLDQRARPHPIIASHPRSLGSFLLLRAMMSRGMIVPGRA